MAENTIHLNFKASLELLATWYWKLFLDFRDFFGGELKKQPLESR
jgi:hypothetical protein